MSEIHELQKRIKELQDMIEAILLAIPREREAREYYTAVSQRTTSEASKKMFSYLAGQEKVHETTLRKKLDELQEELNDTKIKLELERMKIKGERGG